MAAVELARYVVDQLGLDPRDIEPIEELASLAIWSGKEKDPEFVANWREMMAKLNKAGRDE
jgi:hypothetical protein